MQFKNRVLVTGCCGFLGFHLVKHFVDLGYQVIGIDHNLNSIKNRIKYLRYIELKKIDKLQIFDIDLLDSRFDLPLSAIDVLVHAAGLSDVESSAINPELTQRFTIDMTKQLYNSYLYQNSHGLFVYPSSAAVYGLSAQIPYAEASSLGGPISVYAKYKMESEKYLLNQKPGNSLVLRYFSLLGTHMNSNLAIPKIINALSENLEFNIFGNGEFKRDYIDILDAVSFTEKLITISQFASQKSNKIVNIGSGISTSLNDVIHYIESIENKKLRVRSSYSNSIRMLETRADTTQLINIFGPYRLKSVQESLLSILKWNRYLTFQQSTHFLNF